MLTPRAAVLSIGTEVTTGQIVNTNASQIAATLNELGLELTVHIAVQDELKDIVDALGYAADRSDWIFVTGGLGPTSDDITRDAIAAWTDAPLVWNEVAWKHVGDRLASRGREARDVHRKQASFPSGSFVFSNPGGTACGFVMSKIPRWPGQLVVLPGPPKEIALIWNDHVQEYIRARIPLKHVFLYTWLCQGRGESEFAEITERIFAAPKFRIGYRLVDRQTEIKVWVPKDREEEAEPLRKELTQALGNSILQIAGPL